jgi:outer membrane protein assembly factor BamE (lipoprotein component of BamABCDE complex)
MNLEEWREDRNACLSKRAPMAVSMNDQKEKLLGLNEKQLVKLLGRPDQNELYKRNQKFYSYYLTPAPECGTAIMPAQILVIRFNAMGLANEVTLQ